MFCTSQLYVPECELFTSSINSAMPAESKARTYLKGFNNKHYTKHQTPNTQHKIQAGTYTVIFDKLFPYLSVPAPGSHCGTTGTPAVGCLQQPNSETSWCLLSPRGAKAAMLPSEVLWTANVTRSGKKRKLVMNLWVMHRLWYEQTDKERCEMQ